MRPATGAEVDGLVKFLQSCGVPVGNPVEPIVDGDNLTAVIGDIRFTVPLEDVKRGAPLEAQEVEAQEVAPDELYPEYFDPEGE